MRSTGRAFATLLAATGIVLATGCGSDDGADTVDIAPAETTGVAATNATGVSTTTHDTTSDVELPERFDAKHVLVSPLGDDGLRIREVVDQDFGSADRHGYQRVIPHDFGEPTDVTAASPDAPANLSVTQLETDETQIRIGDPAVTVTGQHRYTLSYTLPDAQLIGGVLALDVIGTGDTLETGSVEVIVVGFDLQDPVCSVGTEGSVGGCTLARDGDVHRALISPLPPDQGVTIGGTITGRIDPVEVSEPPLPPRR